MGYPTVFPTGTTVYDPDKCWNGYTVFPAHNIGATIIDMNGNVVKQWTQISSVPGPFRILPGTEEIWVETCQETLIRRPLR